MLHLDSLYPSTGRVFLAAVKTAVLYCLSYCQNSIHHLNPCLASTFKCFCAAYTVCHCSTWGFLELCGSPLWQL